VCGAAAAAILAGCAVGPNYHRPETPVDAQFANAGEPGLGQGDSVERYWDRFADPLLNGLIDDALAHNKGLGRGGGQSAGGACRAAPGRL
jgi:outer membrane protein TolC